LQLSTPWVQRKYEEGIERIEAVLKEAEEEAEIVEFLVDISLHMTSGRVKKRIM